MGTDEELDRIASLNADIGTYENEMIEKFIMNQVSLDTFGSFIETVKAMGGDELTQIYQDQLDRYYGKTE
jgi:putative aldouronate transport system substrate-binding protein